MKKLIALLLALAMVFALAACGGNSAEAPKAGSWSPSLPLSPWRMCLLPLPPLPQISFPDRLFPAEGAFLCPPPNTHSVGHF